MNFDGLLIGAAAFLIIGIFHPIVVKTEYYFGAKVWPVFLLVGVGCIIISTLLDNFTFSAVMGIFGFSCLWSIRELHEQVERVRKGWFPRNPKRES